MHILEALVLGIIQGLSEFLPISSSGHLILAEKLFHLNVGSLVFDVALHAGTLLALLSYFWRDLVSLANDFFTRRSNRLWLYLVIATLPGAVFGFLLESAAETTFRAPVLVALNLFWMGLVMLAVDRRPQTKKLGAMNTADSVKIGFAQALALLPGVSRSGITISTARFMSFDRGAAARFSFLLAIPITAGAIFKVVLGENLHTIASNFGVFAAGVAASAITGYLAIKWVLKYLAGHSLALFAYYRIGLAALVMVILLFS